MALVVIAADSGVLDRAVHPLDLAVGPGMERRLGQPVIDLRPGAGQLEGVGPDEFAGVQRGPDVLGGRADVSGRREVGAVVGEHGVHPVRDQRDQALQEFGRGLANDALVQFDEGELARAVYH